MADSAIDRAGEEAPSVAFGDGPPKTGERDWAGPTRLLTLLPREDGGGACEAGGGGYVAGSGGGRAGEEAPSLVGVIRPSRLRVECGVVEFR